MRRYPYQHMHMVAIDRSSVDGHLVRPRDFPQQLPRPLPDIAAQHRKSALCDPHDMILAVPDRVTAGLRILHTGTVASQSPKGEGFTDPKGGTLNVRPDSQCVAGSRLDDRHDILQDRLPWADAMPWNVFYSYSHKDESWLRRLETFLAPLRQNKLIDEWHDRKIRPGGDWNSEIDSRIRSADLAIMLLSSDFLASEYCFGVEMDTALARVKSNDLQLVPVLMRHCLWKDSRFSELQIIPRDNKPVSRSRSPDEALKAVALEIRTIVSQEKAKP